jgi:hypothetical protein
MGQLEPSTLLGTSDCLAPIPAARATATKPRGSSPSSHSLHVGRGSCSAGNSEPDMRPDLDQGGWPEGAR